MSPRKPSTSSGRSARSRPRYLGIEVAGEQFPGPRSLEQALLRALAPAPARPGFEVRVIRVEAGRAIARIPHDAVARARSAWNGPLELPGRPGITIQTHRTWGTLLKGKRWLDAGRRSIRPAAARP